jgi:hypothetical protein
MFYLVHYFEDILKLMSVLFDMSAHGLLDILFALLNLPADGTVILFGLILEVLVLFFYLLVQTFKVYSWVLNLVEGIQKVHFSRALSFVPEHQKF